MITILIINIADGNLSSRNAEKSRTNHTTHQIKASDIHNMHKI